MSIKKIVWALLGSIMLTASAQAEVKAHCSIGVELWSESSLRADVYPVQSVYTEAHWACQVSPGMFIEITDTRRDDTGQRLVRVVADPEHLAAVTDRHVLNEVREGFKGVHERLDDLESTCGRTCPLPVEVEKVHDMCWAVERHRGVTRDLVRLGEAISDGRIRRASDRWVTQVPYGKSYEVKAPTCRYVGTRSYTPAPQPHVTQPTPEPVVTTDIVETNNLCDIGGGHLVDRWPGYDTYGDRHTVKQGGTIYFVRYCKPKQAQPRPDTPGNSGGQKPNQGGGYGNPNQGGAYGNNHSSSSSSSSGSSNTSSGPNRGGGF